MLWTSLFPTRLITTPVQVGSHGAKETAQCAPGLGAMKEM